MKLFPQSDIFKFKIYYKYFKKLTLINPLNFMKFNKDTAIEILKKNLDWTPYGEKHYESRFTKFYEGFWLPTRFGYDTRKVQFSSLILTGQMTRQQAVQLLVNGFLNEIIGDIKSSSVRKFIEDKIELQIHGY